MNVCRGLEKNLISMIQACMKFEDGNIEYTQRIADIEPHSVICKAVICP